MKKDKANSWRIFDKTFFSFQFKLVLSKISVYASIIIYFLIIATYTIMVPLIANIAPIALFSNFTSSMFLAFAVSIVTCFLAIEIFRTGVDDGTELLTVSKPISRGQIVVVKLFVFLIYVIITTLVSMVISAFTYINPTSEYEDSTTIMLGVLTGTIVNGIIFGSIATILSIFLKKIIAMLTTVGIAFILMLASMLVSTVIETPIQYVYNQGKSISSTNTVNLTTDENNNQTVNLIDSVIVVDSSVNNNATNYYLDANAVWKEASEASGYNNSVKFDFGYQLSSLFTLNKINGDFNTILRRLAYLNSPVELSFTKFDTTNITKIPYNYTTTNVDGTSTTNAGFFFLNNNWSSRLRGDGISTINKNVSYSSDQIINLVNELSFENNTIWTRAWNTYQATNNGSPSQPQNASEFASNFFTINSLTTTNAEQLVKQFNQIQYAAYYSLYTEFKDTGMSLSDFFTITIDESGAITYTYNYENIVKIGLLGIEINSTTNGTDSASFSIASATNFTYNNIQYRISNLFNLSTDNIMQNAYTVTVFPVLNNEILISVWIIVAIVIFAISIALYFRRDFA